MITRLDQISENTIEGKMLLIAVSMLSTELDLDCDDVIKEINKLKSCSIDMFDLLETEIELKHENANEFVKLAKKLINKKRS